MVAAQILFHIRAFYQVTQELKEQLISSLHNCPVFSRNEKHIGALQLCKVLLEAVYGASDTCKLLLTMCGHIKYCLPVLMHLAHKK